jgi:ABC-2 type transport system ATP-binding protein
MMNDPSRPMRTYSRGNKQKAGLVAAFMRRPDLLILDEPTGGLDPLIQQHVLELVRSTRMAGRFALLPRAVRGASGVRSAGIVREEIVATERVEAIIGSVRPLALRFERMPPPGASDDGVAEIDRRRLDRLEIRHNLNQVLADAVAYGVLELDKDVVSLEEVFMAYYTKDGERRNEPVAA